MARPNSTSVVIAGTEAPAVLDRLSGLANVHVARSSEDVVRSHTVYVVHDHDPLADVAAAWEGLFDGTEPVGGLEVAVEQALAALRRGGSDRGEGATLPDYYLVLDPEDLPETRRHWWFGVLASAAPARVQPSSSSDVAAVRGVIGHLPVGPWWPDPPDEWLRGLGRAVPDRVGVPGA